MFFLQELDKVIVFAKRKMKISQLLINSFRGVPMSLLLILLSIMILGNLVQLLYMVGTEVGNQQLLMTLSTACKEIIEKSTELQNPTRPAVLNLANQRLRTFVK